MRRISASVVTALVLLVLVATPAGAHSAAGTSASNFRTTITAQATGLEGVRVRVVEGGSRLELTNSALAEVVVVGYAGEPYLRVSRDRVLENRRAPTWFLNRTRGGQAEPGGDAGAEPDWRVVGSGPPARWFDHRTHWTGAEPPPQVRAQPGRRHVVEAAWRVPLVQGGVTSEVTGTLVWEPGPSPAPWLAGAAALALATAALSRARRWGPPLAAAVLVLLLVDLVHSAGVSFAVAGSVGARLVATVTGSFYAIVGWVLAVVAIRLLRRDSVDGLYAAVFAGLSIAVFGGLLDLETLSRSVVPLAVPVWLGRLSVMVAMGLGGGVALASALVIRRTPPEVAPQP